MATTWLQLLPTVLRRDSSRPSTNQSSRVWNGGSSELWKASDRVSVAKLESSKAADAIDKTGTVVISDGCPAYAPWCKKHQFKHFACNHSKQIWVRNVNRGRLGVLKVHTGRIDSRWNLAKKFLPSNLLTQSGKNKDVMLWLRCWQWRYERSCDDLLTTTGQKLNEL